ncbi:MAG: hypothetical protein JWQ95_5408 [Sphaerisporangium sp.]|jgi:hypothetical protein|nr:hypothetical protein [Sphaerisporangium sp.]
MLSQTLDCQRKINRCPFHFRRDLISSNSFPGHSPSLASIYRALAEHDKAQAYPDAITQAHAEFAELKADA